jgi:hypothetical protein
VARRPLSKRSKTWHATSKRTTTRPAKAPSPIAYHVQGKGQDKSFWTRIGAAWDHEDGKGLTLQLDVLPVAGAVSSSANLRKQPRRNIESSSQAAEALKPVAGAFAELIFALGIIGTGLLAIPVLAGATAYAIGEGRKWPVGLSRKPKEAMAFYAVLALSVALGIALNFTAIDPIKALYWSAVVNGVLAAPVMIIMMLLVRRKSVMGNLIVTGPVCASSAWPCRCEAKRNFEAK